ncbi:MAG: hypothetical protein ACREDM_09015 [Methylocella sp.]
MPAWSAAARDLRDMEWLPQRKGQCRDGPGVEGHHGERKPAATANNFACMEKFGGVAV